MREIKFRQPLFIKGKFSRFHYWGFISKGNFSSPTNDWIDGEASQQYTGLLDKNGKEIYEGDICNVEGAKNIGVIKWNEKDAGFVIVSKGILVTANEISFSDYSPKFCEVIGNIHENPELLTDVKGEG